VQPGRDPRRDAVEKRAIGRDRAIEKILEPVSGGPKTLGPALVDEVGIQREVELNVAAPSRDCVGDEASLDLDGVSDELVDVAIGGAVQSERVCKERRRGKRDLEGTIGDRGDVSSFARRGAVDLAQTILDPVYRQRDGLSAGIRELDLVPVGREALDSVVEGVQEHPAAKLPVRDHIEAAVDLAPHGRGDRLVLGSAKPAEILRTLRGEKSVMTRLVYLLHGRSQRRRPEEAPDHLGSSGSARGRHPAILRPYRLQAARGGLS
jgi:hypothetical protein